MFEWLEMSAVFVTVSMARTAPSLPSSSCSSVITTPTFSLVTLGWTRNISSFRFWKIENIEHSLVTLNWHSASIDQFRPSSFLWHPVACEGGVKSGRYWEWRIPRIIQTSSVLQPLNNSVSDIIAVGDKTCVKIKQNDALLKWNCWKNCKLCVVNCVGPTYFQFDSFSIIAIHIQWIPTSVFIYPPQHFILLQYS